MTEAQFKQLALKDQYKHIESNGAFVGQRIYTTYNIHLYAVDGFYVEVWTKLGLGHLYWIEVVHSRETLLQYTNDIDLNDLLK